jgi:ubiquinone/menaquinone biosynthesis C-methylase UbiE
VTIATVSTGSAGPTAWEEAYQRFETPEQEQRKFIRRLRTVGAHRWSRELSVVEVCSGRGNGLVAWQRLGFEHVCGVDLSPALVVRSAVRTRSVIGDACRMPILTASRDVAIVQGGLHHLPTFLDVRAALAEMRRVLKPDGRVVIIEPWATPFLHLVHFISERKLARRLSNTLDAFAAMTDEERPTYEAWLSRPSDILDAIRAEFEGLLIRRRYGKLVFLGRPRLS